jgi:hypothetical protein
MSKSEDADKDSALKKVVRTGFLHNHGPFEKDCNSGCGVYEIGRQITSYDPAQKKHVPIKQ